MRLVSYQISCVIGTLACSLGPVALPSLLVARIGVAGALRGARPFAVEALDTRTDKVVGVLALDVRGHLADPRVHVVDASGGVALVDKGIALLWAEQALAQALAVMPPITSHRAFMIYTLGVRSRAPRWL